MDASTFPQIRQSYRTMLEERRADDYVAALCREGISWWFETRIPEIAVHLMSLQGAVPAVPPPRLVFLAETIKPRMDPDVFADLCDRFRAEGDLEAAAAAACAGATSIWDSGVNFERFAPWHERISELLEGLPPLSDLVRAGLFCFRAQIELTGRGDVRAALRSYRDLMVCAEKADSLSLRLFGAAGQIYPLLWLGRVSEIEALTMSAGPLRDLPEVSLICKVYYATSLALWLTVRGEPAAGEEILTSLAGQPFFGLLPPSIKLLAQGHLLTACAFQGKADLVKSLATKVLEIAAPLGNSFHSSYAHYCAGVASLLVGELRQALAHAREAASRGRASGSPIPERTNPLLEGQALLDLRQSTQARTLLAEWVDRWRESGFLLYAVSGLRELASLSVSQGRLDAARASYQEVKALLPRGENPPQLHRPACYVGELERVIETGNGDTAPVLVRAAAAVRIQTFGELVVDLGGTVIYDRNWRGMATKKLLKAIIVLGGRKVSFAALADWLWPDAEGGAGARNLKVAIHRLKRLGLADGQEPAQWLAVKQMTVSLTGLCYADSIAFEDALAAAPRRQDNIDRLTAALDLYRDDFLKNDSSEPWIVQRRELLLDKFIRGVLRLSDLAARNRDADRAVPYLDRALEHAPLREDLYERLMQSHLESGYPSKALLLFRQAERRLRRDLGTRPGKRLTALARRARFEGG